jgi:pimeloyl-ACP methyl ester carboxylesterase
MSDPRTIDIGDGAQLEPVKLDYFGTSRSRKLLLIVGGSGDTRRTLAPLAVRLARNDAGYDVATFSFRGMETGRSYPLRQQVTDLQEVLEYLAAHIKKDITILCTSKGAYSTCFALASDKNNAHIAKAIFLDPADYEMTTDREAGGAETLSGPDPYIFNSNTASSLLGQINADVIIDVMRLTIRNFGPDGYPDPSQRGQDNPQLYPRLNAQMVATFYERTPAPNRGQYVEVPGVPHAFGRDGDIPKNIEALYAAILSLIRPAA